MTTTRSGHNFKDFAVLEIPKEGEPHYFLEQPCSIIDTGSKLVIEFEVHAFMIYQKWKIRTTLKMSA